MFVTVGNGKGSEIMQNTRHSEPCCECVATLRAENKALKKERDDFQAKFLWEKAEHMSEQNISAMLTKERDDIHKELDLQIEKDCLLRTERDELAAKCAAMKDVCFIYASHNECEEIDASLPPRAKALLECVEKAKKVSESYSSGQKLLRIHMEALDKALAGLDVDKPE